MRSKSIKPSSSTPGSDSKTSGGYNNNNSNSNYNTTTNSQSHRKSV